MWCQVFEEYLKLITGNTVQYSTFNVNKNNENYSSRLRYLQNLAAAIWVVMYITRLLFMMIRMNIEH
jgi:hypothetical protein